MRNLESYLAGRWHAAPEEGKPLLSAVDSAPIAGISSAGIDFGEMLEYARNVGGPALRKETFHQRAMRLKALAKFLLEHKKEFYALSSATGATKTDSWIDIDGGIQTLFVFSSKGRREMPNDTVYLDGPPEQISRNGTFTAQHICVPLEGVAVHINAFNFPCWGMLEKLAPAILAGMPVIVKPASSTAYLTELMFRRIIESGTLPEGAVQLVCGSTGNLLDQLTCQDAVAFTGSATTGKMLSQNAAIVDNSVRFTMEADSLNCSILAEDARPGTDEFDLFVKEVVNEMTVKAGQKCTAIRRAIVPEAYLDDVGKALRARLEKIQVGNPNNPDVRMGALASMGQRQEVRERVQELMATSDLIYGGLDEVDLLDANGESGAFLSPILLQCADGFSSDAVHDVEAFGPVSTLIPYNGNDEAIALAKRGQGSLVGSIFTYDANNARELALGAAAWHGRLLINNRDCAKESTGHGSPLPHLVHGGPGRAGGGEEMGGIRGVLHYMQRTAVQGSPDMLSAVGNRWIRGAQVSESDTHPFRKHLEELKIGEGITCDPRTVSLEDIEHFADFTGDKFYAHMDEEAAKENPFFEGRVAHGYFIVSAAAGQFVDPAPGPVLANTGLENLKFMTPLNPHDAMTVSFVCKQKKAREDEDYGEVRWDTQITNQDGEIVAQYDVLTMVKKRDTSE